MPFLRFIVQHRLNFRIKRHLVRKRRLCRWPVDIHVEALAPKKQINKKRFVLFLNITYITKLDKLFKTK